MSYTTGSFPVTADGAVVGRVAVSQNGLLLVFDCTCEYEARDILRLAAVCHGNYVPLGVMVPEAGLLRTKKSFTKNALQSAGYEDTGLFHLIRPEAVYAAPAAEAPAPPTQAEAQPATEEQPDAQAAVPVSGPVVYNDFPDPEEYIFDYRGESEPETEPPPTVPAPAEITDSPVPVTCSRDPVTEEGVTETDAAQAEPAAEEPAAPPETAGGWVVIPNPGILFEDQTIGASCQGVSNAMIMEGDGCLLLAVPVLPTEPFPLMPVFCFGSSGQIGGRDCVVFKIKNGNLIL